MEERVVIHDHLVAVDDVVVRMASDGDLLAELDEVVTALDAVLASHFAYEEQEMSEPLGLLGLPL